MAKHKRAERKNSGLNRGPSANAYAPSGRGATMRPSQAVGPRPPAGGMTTRPGGGHPLPPKGVAAKSAHIIGSAVIPAGGKMELYLVPKEYPYFTAHAANVSSNVEVGGSKNVNIRAFVGDKAVQGLQSGFQKLNWPPGSTTGLAREVLLVLYNHGNVTAKVNIDLSVMPMDHL